MAVPTNGPKHCGRALNAALIGMGAFGVFYGVAHVVRRHPTLNEQSAAPGLPRARLSTFGFIDRRRQRHRRVDVLSQGMWSATPMRKPILTLARIMATTATRNQLG